MLWARMVAYVTGTVNQELLLRNECLGAESRILRGQIKGRVLLSEGEKATLAEIAQFRELIESGSVKTIRLPARSPNLNSFAEPWVRSVKEECLSS